MKVKSLISLIICAALSVMHIHAQRGHSFTVGGGIGYYYGDLTDGFSNVMVRPAGTISYGYYFTPSLSFRLGLSASQIGAADSLSPEPSRRARNLHFRTTIYELSTILYWEFFPDKKFGVYWKNKPHLTPYAFGGVTLFAFDPRAKYQGQWNRLQPIGTEGQFLPTGDNPGPYSLLQAAIPVGGGLSWRFSSNVAISADVGYRFTFTDYLDDVSTNYPDLGLLGEVKGSTAVALSDPSGRGLTGQRGNPGAKDGYFFAMVNLTFYLDRDGRQ